MKDKFRKLGKDARNNLSEIERERKSHQIFEKLLQLPEFKESKNILIYISYGAEVVTHFMAKRLLNSGVQIYVPKVEKKKMIACRLDHWEDLEFGQFELLEPKDIIEIKHPSEIDLVVVPGLAFSTKGDRLGHGHGFYDQFLSQSKAHKIGLAFEEQIINEIPTEPHDIPMDLIVTDQNIIRP